MSLIAIAVPFFLLALLVELAIDRFRGTGHYRANDAVNSLSAGALSTTTGYFTRYLQVFIWGLVLQNFAIIDMQLSWFDASPRGIALWLLALIGWDFFYYWQHRCSHEISVLWAAHAVHHQSEDYNLSTALRQTSTSFLFTWVFYLPLFVIGFPIEILVTVNAIDLIYQFWVHTQHVGRLGWMDRVFVTPSNHRVHHAQNQVYIDRNYGGILILWDRLFGSFQEELDEEPVVFGVRKPLASWNPFWANIQVYDYLWFDAVRTKRWRDKLGIWFRRTGWRPADVEARYPKRNTRLEDFHKFDPQISLATKRYVAWQFVAVALFILWIGALFAERGTTAVVIPCLMLWAALYGFGLLTESRPMAARLEAIRLLVVVPAGVFGMMQIGVLPSGGAAIWQGVAAYVVLSLLALAYSTRRVQTSVRPSKEIPT